MTLVTAFNYQTPRATSNKIVRAVSGNWVFGGVLTYRSGALISVPASVSSNIGAYTFQSTRFNRVERPESLHASIRAAIASIPIATSRC